MSSKQLFDFIGRADTPDKLDIAEQWFNSHKKNFSRSDYDTYILAINEKRKRLFLTRIIQNKKIMINVNTGEVF